MVQRFLVRFISSWWLVLIGLGFAVFGIIEDTAWWALTFAATFFLPLALATWIHDRDHRLEEQRKKKYEAHSLTTTSYLADTMPGDRHGTTTSGSCAHPAPARLEPPRQPGGGDMDG